MTSKHGNVRSGIHELVGQLVQAHQKREEDIAAIAQENLSRTSSVKSEMDARFSEAQTQQMQAQMIVTKAKLTGEKALLEAEKSKVKQQFAFLQTERKIRQEVQATQKRMQETELVAKQAETTVQGVVAVLPKHREYMDVLQ